MSLRDEIEQARVSDEVKNAMLEISDRADIPDDVKQHYVELRQQLEQTESALQNTVSELRQLSHQVKVRERREKKLQHQLIYNQKTGLGNHHLLDRDLAQLIDESQVSGKQRTIFVLIIALDDQYDTVKKSASPTVGEWIIYQTGERLRSTVPGNGRLYHTRDSEFVMVLVNPFSPGYLETFANRIAKEVGTPFQFPDFSVSLGCNIGAAIYPDHGATKNLVLRNADLAATQAIKRHRQISVYQEEMGEVVIEKMELQNSIIRALEEQAINEINKQFLLYFQPVVRVEDFDGAAQSESDVKYRVSGAESLIRWRHPTRGMVPPGRFIPVAEETGLIIPIGNWVLFTACDQLKAWSETSLNDLYISVNLSPRQFRDEYLLYNLKRVITRSEISPELLKLEVTEGIVMEDLEDSVEKLKAISDLGITISIDDFGTGYSSLNYLKQLPIDLLKLDRTFIDDLLVNKHTQGIVRAILAMADSMNIRVIAEGIESFEQLRFLVLEGCSEIQGFYFGEPLSAYDFQKQLQDRRNG
jgi:EAL domain-containing protein (putative c-di-GMP-specific phosphodiesterase class I)/GGDEF domain-containing protein